MGDILYERWIFAGMTVEVPKDELTEHTELITSYAKRVGGNVLESVADATDDRRLTVRMVISSPGHIGISPRDFLENRRHMEAAGLELYERLGFEECPIRREFFNLYPIRSNRREYCLEHTHGVFHYAYTVRDRKFLEEEHPSSATDLFHMPVNEELQTLFREVEEHLSKKTPRERRKYTQHIVCMKEDLAKINIKVD